jgi:hypothetical protein
VSFISDGIDDYEGESDAMGFDRYGVGEVRRQVVAAKALIDGLARRMAKSSGKPRQQWDRFKEEWDNFYQSTQGVEGAFTQFRDATYTRTLDFQQRAEGLSKALETAAKGELAKPVGKSVTQQKSGSSYSWSPSIGWNIPWGKILLWGGISAGGIWVGHKIYRRYHPVGKLTAPKEEPVPELTDGGIEHGG